MKQLVAVGLALALCGGAAMAQPRSASSPELLLSAPTGLMAPVWSPDGSKIAVTSDNYAGIFVANADGSALRAITDADGAGYKMVWSGNDAITGSTRTIERGRMMHQVCTWSTVDGSATVTVAKDRRRTLPAVARGAAGLYSAMLANPDLAATTPALAEFTGAMVINPALSPDGSQIAFQVAGRGMWLINADGTGLRNLGTGSHPAWLPDGKSIVYTVVTDNGSEFTSSTLYAMDTRSGRKTILTAAADILPLTPAVSPDGQKVAFENARDNAIYVVTLKY